MLIRYQTNDKRHHQQDISDRMGTIHDEEDQGIEFLRSIASCLRGATFYRCGVPFKSFACSPDLGLRQVNP